MNSMLHHKGRRERGQSLSEVALLIPIILIILAGAIEVSNLIVGQSRVDTAIRTTTRFGSNGGSNDGMSILLQQTLTPTLKLDEELWDVWIVRGTVNSTGNDYVSGTWSLAHTYGAMSTNGYADLDEGTIQNAVLENLQQDATNQAQAANLEFVGVLAFHKISSILGLDIFIQGFNEVRALGVMRVNQVATVNASKGCPAFPLLVEQGIRSIAEESSELNGVFPSADDIEYPTPPPSLGDFFHTVPSTTDLFHAQEGYIFYIPLNIASPDPQSASVSFAHWNWSSLFWENDLNQSLQYPGNSQESCDPGRGWYHPILGCELDRELHVGDPVAVSQLDSSIIPVNTKSILNEHIDLGRTMRVLLYSANAAPVAYSSQVSFEITNFAIIRPLAYDLQNTPGNEKFLLFEFIRLDASCGQPIE